MAIITGSSIVTNTQQKILASMFQAIHSKRDPPQMETSLQAKIPVSKKMSQSVSTEGQISVSESKDFSITMQMRPANLQHQKQWAFSVQISLLDVVNSSDIRQTTATIGRRLFPPPPWTPCQLGTGSSRTFCDSAWKSPLCASAQWVILLLCTSPPAIMILQLGISWQMLLLTLEAKSIPTCTSAVDPFSSKIGCSVPTCNYNTKGMQPLKTNPNLDLRCLQHYRGVC